MLSCLNHKILRIDTSGFCIRNFLLHYRWCCSLNRSGLSSGRGRLRRYMSTALLATWQHRARRILNEPRKLREGESFFHASRVSNTLNDLAKPAPDDASGQLRLYDFIHAAIEALYASNARWKATTKNVIDEIGGFDAESARLLRALTTRDHTLDERLVLAGALAARALRTPLQWPMLGPKWEMTPKSTIVSLEGDRVVLRRPLP